MDITINLALYEIKEAIEEYVNKRGYTVDHLNNDILFIVEKTYDYYDNPTSPMLTQATVKAKKAENDNL